jgi:hypothetical protein
MPNLLTIKIDVTKIDKARLFQGKNGAKYLDLVCIPSPNDKYGNTHFVTQSVTKEERQGGLKLPILGNAKEMLPRDGYQDDAPAERSTPPRRSAPAPRQGPTERQLANQSDDDTGDVDF